jgi:hypothetical protein
MQHFLYGANLDVTVSTKTCTIEGILNKMKEWKEENLWNWNGPWAYKTFIGEELFV